MDNYIEYKLIKKLLFFLLPTLISGCAQNKISINENIEVDSLDKRIECQQFLPDIKQKWGKGMGRDEVSVFYSPKNHSCLFKTFFYVEYSDGRGGEYWQELYDVFTDEEIMSCRSGIEPPANGCNGFDEKLKEYQM